MKALTHESPITLEVSSCDRRHLCFLVGTARPRPGPRPGHLGRKQVAAVAGSATIGRTRSPAMDAPTVPGCDVPAGTPSASIAPVVWARARTAIRSMPWRCSASAGNTTSFCVSTCITARRRQGSRRVLEPESRPGGVPRTFASATSRTRPMAMVSRVFRTFRQTSRGNSFGCGSWWIRSFPQLHHRARAASHWRPGGGPGWTRLPLPPDVVGRPGVRPR